MWYGLAAIGKNRLVRSTAVIAGTFHLGLDPKNARGRAGEIKLHGLYVIPCFTFSLSRTAHAQRRQGMVSGYKGVKLMGLWLHAVKVKSPDTRVVNCHGIRSCTNFFCETSKGGGCVKARGREG